MNTDDSVALIFRAKEGERDAWEELYKRYYHRWINQFHGRLGRKLHRLHDTEDLVQSAFAKALANIHKLQHDAAFFSWVSTFIERKIVDCARMEFRSREIPFDEVKDFSVLKEEFGFHLEKEEELCRLLDVMLELFKTNPDDMALLYLRYFAENGISTLMEIYGVSERSIHRWIETALRLLRSKFHPF